MSSSSEERMSDDDVAIRESEDSSDVDSDAFGDDDGSDEGSGQELEMVSDDDEEDENEQDREEPSIARAQRSSGTKISFILSPQQSSTSQADTTSTSDSSLKNTKGNEVVQNAPPSGPIIFRVGSAAQASIATRIGGEQSSRIQTAADEKESLQTLVQPQNLTPTSGGGNVIIACSKYIDPMPVGCLVSTVNRDCGTEVGSRGLKQCGAYTYWVSIDRHPLVILLIYSF
eukprot:m.698638 g.698638  ORF g.698638 m.698638 type:complete len:229 (-) comp22902_c1_seq2:61-747(-)